MANPVPQQVVVVPDLATFQSTNVAAYANGGAQLAYLQGTVTELDGGQAFYQRVDNNFSSPSNPPDLLVDGAGNRWAVTSAVSQAQIVSALTTAGTLPGLDPLTTQGANIASATTTDLSAATGNYVNITGTTTITGLGTIAAGKLRFVTFTGILTLTHNATSLILPGGANITTAAGDAAIFVSLGSGNWKCIVYTEAAGGTPGTLGVPQGGTGQVSFTLGNILTGNGASALGSFAPGAGVVTFLTTPSSVNLAAAVTDETGSGALVFANTPTLVTPVLGAASATSVSFSSTSGIIGTATNDSAAAGSVGEFISSNVASGSAVSLTTGTPANVTSISLTAGDWDVWGIVCFTANVATTMSQIFVWIHNVSATLPSAPNGGAFQSLEIPFTTGGRQDLSAGQMRISLAATTTIYLGTRASFAENTLAAYGFIGARRVR